MCATIISRSPWPGCDKTSPDVAGVTRWWEEKEHGRTLSKWIDSLAGKSWITWEIWNIPGFLVPSKETVLMERSLLKILDWSLMKKLLLLLKLTLYCYYSQNSSCSCHDFINFPLYPSEVNKGRDEREREVAKHPVNKQENPQHHPATTDDSGEISVHDLNENNDFGKCIIIQLWSIF